MLEFSRWLQSTDLSQWIQVTDWLIPLVQSIHIAAVAVLFGSVFMVNLRVLGAAWRSQTMLETNRRFAPWFWGALVVLVLTGTILVIGEPVREIMTLSFRVKLGLIVAGAILGAMFLASVRRRPDTWDVAQNASVKLYAILFLLLWVAIIVLGRLIAWDPEIFGALSPYPG